MEAPGKPDGEHDAGLARGVNDDVGAGKIERDRLFDKDMFARRGRRERLRLVLAVRRRQHHGVDVRIAQDLLVAVGERDVLVAAKILRARSRACVGAHEFDIVAVAGNGRDQRAAPAAQSDDGGADHCVEASGCVDPQLLKMAAMAL